MKTHPPAAEGKEKEEKRKKEEEKKYLCKPTAHPPCSKTHIIDFHNAIKCRAGKRSRGPVGPDPLGRPCASQQKGILEQYPKIMRNVRRFGKRKAALLSLTGVSPPASSALSCVPRPRLFFSLFPETALGRGFHSKTLLANRPAPSILKRGQTLHHSAAHRAERFWKDSGRQSEKRHYRPRPVPARQSVYRSGPFRRKCHLPRKSPPQESRCLPKNHPPRGKRAALRQAGPHPAVPPSPSGLRPPRDCQRHSPPPSCRVPEPKEA